MCNDRVEDTASETSKEEEPDQECQRSRRSKTVSETSSVETSYSQESDTEELTMAELELLKKLEEANRLWSLSEIIIGDNRV